VLEAPGVDELSAVSFGDSNNRGSSLMFLCRCCENEAGADVFDQFLAWCSHGSCASTNFRAKHKSSNPKLPTNAVQTTVPANKPTLEAKSPPYASSSEKQMAKHDHLVKYAAFKHAAEQSKLRSSSSWRAFSTTLSQLARRKPAEPSF
jgi:hypothetical protein